MKISFTLPLSKDISIIFGSTGNIITFLHYNNNAQLYNYVLEILIYLGLFCYYMRRKVSLIGPATLSVSLPSKWAKANNVKKGDEVEVTEEGNRLEISSKCGVTLSSVDLKIKKTNYSHLKSIIANAYKKGYDQIVVEYDDESILKDLQKAVDSLLGIEIVSRSQKRCEIRNIARELETEFSAILKNSFINLLELSNDVLESVKTNNFDKLEEIEYKKDTITKYTDFCKRVLNKHRKSHAEMIFEYLIVWNLEKIANEYKYIYKYGRTYSLKDVSQDLISFFIESNRLLLLYYQAFYEKNDKKIEQISQIKEHTLFKQYYDSFSNRDVAGQAVRHHLANIIRRVWDMCGPFYGLYF